MSDTETQNFKFETLDPRRAHDPELARSLNNNWNSLDGFLKDQGMDPLFSQDISGLVRGPTDAEITAGKILGINNTWVDAAGGSDSEIQFNANGKLAGSSTFVYDGIRVGIGTSNPHISALLDLSSTSLGLLLSKMTTTEKEGITTPTSGLLVYDITINQPGYFNGSNWISIPGSETLAQTLINGNTTGGNDIIVSSGDSIISPTGVGSGSGIPLNIVAGAAGPTGTFGGTLSLLAGDGGTVAGGPLSIFGGMSSAQGGTVNVFGGDGGIGGILNLGGGTSGANLIGGIVNISGGPAGGGNADGGSVNINGGSLAGTGSVGNVILQQFSGNVGIGISSTPDGTLHVHSGSAGGIGSTSAADDLTVENSSDGGISILVPDANTAAFNLGSPGRQVGVFLRWNFTTNRFDIGTGNTNADISIRPGINQEAMLLKANGTVNVIVDLTTPSIDTASAINLNIGKTNALSINSGTGASLWDHRGRMHILTTGIPAVPTLTLQTTGLNGGLTEILVGVNVPTGLVGVAGSLYTHNNQSGPGGLYVNTSTISGTTWTLMTGAGGTGGIYAGNGTVPTATVATLTDSLTFASGNIAVPDGVVTASNLKTHTLIENRSTLNVTTVLSTFTLIASAGTVSFSGRPVLFMFNATLFAASAGNNEVEFSVRFGTGADNVIANRFMNPQDVHLGCTGMVILTPSAGDSLVTMRWRRVSGTGTLTFNNDDHLLLYAVEL